MTLPLMELKRIEDFAGDCGLIFAFTDLYQPWNPRLQIKVNRFLLKAGGPRLQ